MARHEHTAARHAESVAEGSGSGSVGLESSEGCATAQRGTQPESTAAERIPYDDLWPDARDALMDWLRLHRVDPKQTPIDPVIELDSAVGEWRIEQYAGSGGRLRLTADQTEVERIVIRRVSRASLPWPEVQR